MVWLPVRNTFENNIDDVLGLPVKKYHSGSELFSAQLRSRLQFGLASWHGQENELR
jgi:hypothetical protein